MGVQISLKSGRFSFRKKISTHKSALRGPLYLEPLVTQSGRTATLGEVAVEQQLSPVAFQRVLYHQLLHHYPTVVLQLL